MNFVDTHCHLHFKKFGLPNRQAYEDALKAGVTRMICVGTTLEDSKHAIDFAAGLDRVWAAAGVHPHEAGPFLKQVDGAKQLAGLLGEPKIVAVGEIGLDYYKSQTPREVQEKALRAQIEAGLPTGLPFIFHIRDAWRDFWRIFDEYKDLRGVVHSFSSGTKQLNMALDRGLYVGLNGIMTFTRDEAQLEAARQVPLDRLVLETDAPFLAPVPFRSEVCEPKHIVNVAEFLADLRGQPIKELSLATTDNAVRLFNLK
ncbi:MAG TPA: TatD family hydrolase [Candidatus Saccharimonadales bacterium]|nr:TatD family hydrolase [Candidatus Saccharimonadales bacterium]